MAISHLTFTTSDPNCYLPDGWMTAGRFRREESPGSTETRCRVTPGGGDPRESATESKPPAVASAKAGKGERVR